MELNGRARERGKYFMKWIDGRGSVDFNSRKQIDIFNGALTETISGQRYKMVLWSNLG